MKQEVRDILDKYFNIYTNQDELELEAWTDGGVDMFIMINPSSDKPISSQLSDYASSFNIWDEIECYIHNVDYRRNFTPKESFKDFQGWIDWINTIADEIKGVE